jgi:hypothetical protein
MQLQLWRNQMSPERWEKLQEQQKKMVRLAMNKERYLTDSPVVGKSFDLDDDNQDDLPGTNLSKHLKIA